MKAPVGSIAKGTEASVGMTDSSDEGSSSGSIQIGLNRNRPPANSAAPSATTAQKMPQHTPALSRPATQSSTAQRGLRDSAALARPAAQGKVATKPSALSDSEGSLAAFLEASLSD